MARATRTINPLHFEDLEPHRFEDLVRQLAHDFRPWRSLEATGRLGNDEGVDIRGWEIVRPEATAEDDETPPAEPDREWSFQVKRQQRLGPADLRTIVEEAVATDRPPPYGLVIAAACDVSADALAAFREEALKRGVVETKMWSNAHLEDALFRPENDHLLFAYFDISLTTKRRAQLAELRAMLALKRKIRSIVSDKDDDSNRELRQAIVVRDMEAPYGTEEWFKQTKEHVQDYAPFWHAATLAEIHPSGAVIERFRYEGIVRQDGAWDIREDSRWWATNGWDYQHLFEGGEDPTRQQFWGGGDEPDKKMVSEVRLIPWANIVDVDPGGDSVLSDPHLICRYDGEDGPYTGRRHFTAYVGNEHRWLREADRRSLFEATEDVKPAPKPKGVRAVKAARRTPAAKPKGE